ncbi:hypothetical protein AB0M29_20300 [Streptomyces sp. NPDC051976]|uniref:hypothetical protein n=1 Tax=Streptomyces sp. NPDC051976 TaxID=3154947 RepID=UPI00341884F3
MPLAEAVRTDAAVLSSPGVVVLVVFVLLYLGVVLPAVWSRQSYRRQAATRVLELMFGQLLFVLSVLAGLLRR